MKLNISKLRRKVINSFVPIGESLRNEGLSDNEIVRAFNNHMDLKVRNYYKSLDRNISRVVLSLVKPLKKKYLSNFNMKYHHIELIF